MSDGLTDKETKERGEVKAKAKPRKRYDKRLLEAQAEVAEELAIQKDEARGIINPLPHHLKRANASAQIRALWPDGTLFILVSEIAAGVRKATREQLAAAKDLMDRGWGKAPETHIVGSMDQEQREAAAALTKEQLLGLLDTSAAEVAGPVVEGIVVTTPTT